MRFVIYAFFPLQFLEPLEVQLLIMHNSQITFWFPAQAVICTESPTDRHCLTAVRAIRFLINVGYNDTYKKYENTQILSRFFSRFIRVSDHFACNPLSSARVYQIDLLVLHCHLESRLRTPVVSLKATVRVLMATSVL